MRIYRELQTFYERFLSDTKPSALRNKPPASTRMLNEILRVFRAFAGQLLAGDDDMLEIILTKTEASGADDRLHSQWLEANRLNPVVWGEAARVRFQVITLMQWLARAPDVFSYGDPG